MLVGNSSASALPTNLPTNKRATAKRAHTLVKQAIDDGKLTRPDRCELCGCNAAEWEAIPWRKKLGRKFRIYAHHWRGYEYPLDVWWVCQPCNWKLRKKHDGMLIKEDAQELVGKWDANNPDDESISELVGKWPTADRPAQVG